MTLKRLAAKLTPKNAQLITMSNEKSGTIPDVLARYYVTSFWQAEWVKKLRWKTIELPSSSLSTFEDFVGKLDADGKDYYIMGDFNFRLFITLILGAIEYIYIDICALQVLKLLLLLLLLLILRLC